MEKNYRFDKEGKMNQVDKELMQEKGILTENEKADEYESQKAAMKEAVFSWLRCWRKIWICQNFRQFPYI